MFSLVLYGFAVVVTILSFRADREKTRLAFRSAGRSLLNLLPTMLGIVGAVGLLLAIVPPNWIATYLGEQAGYAGTAVAALFGSITLIPGLIAFPLAGTLYQEGASTMTVAAFISTLTMVGVVTAPAETEQLGRRLTIWRNSLSLTFALLIAVLMEVILS